MKAVIIYGSLLGKTARIAELVGEALNSNGILTTVKDVQNTNVFEINGYDLVILASSTWDDGQLQYDFREFNKALRKTNFSGKKFAVFCLGSHRYPHPFYAGDILAETVQLVQGTHLPPVLKLDIDHDEPENKRDSEALDWTAKLLEQIL